VKEQAVISYLVANKEWIFSGVGLTALGVIVWGFKKLSGSAGHAAVPPPSPVVVKLVHPEPAAVDRIEPASEVGAIVQRFNQVLALMNQNRPYGKYSVASLAQLMKLHSVGELESVFLGKREPSFAFIDHFCDCFGVDRKWLIEGRSAPFSDSDLGPADPLGCLAVIEAAKPERIYFIRSHSKVGEVFILLQFADWKYKVLHRHWHISDHVGAGGEAQIFGFYKLIQALRASPYNMGCGGRILEPDKFDSLYSGEVFAGSIIEFPHREDPWWDDFTDVDHKFPIAANYEEWYGKGFIAAQAIVRAKLKRSA
jgi:hypothetical protein